MPRVYCATYGCLNSAMSKPDLSFFKLPTNLERRSRWLHLIGREDLMHRPPHNYTVCEDHFATTDILLGNHRSRLKSISLPSLNLPKSRKRDAETSTEAPASVDIYTQTDTNVTFVASVGIQTHNYHSLDKPEKRKPQDNILERGKKVKLNEIFNKTGKNQENSFYELCDKFLTKDLADLVKAQAHLKLSSPGNGFDEIISQQSEKLPTTTKCYVSARLENMETNNI